MHAQPQYSLSESGGSPDKYGAWPSLQVRHVIEQLGVTKGLQDVERAAHQICKTMGHFSDEAAYSAMRSANCHTFSCKAFRIPPHTANNVSSSGGLQSIA